MIEVRGLSKLFVTKEGNLQALEDITLTVRDNEFLTLLGPSGCGKTTLLKNMAGLIPWDDGEIVIDGVPVSGPSLERSMVFQNFALLPWAPVLENVAFGLKMRGVPKKQREETARRFIRMVGLDGFEKRLPRELSGGMQQRVGIARALSVEPKVLFMDEPFSAVDEQTRRLLQEELLRIWEAARPTVVFVTHSMQEAALLGDRVALMSPRPGKIDQIIDVPLPRPRSANLDAIERSPELAAITTDLWRRLRSMHREAGRLGADVTAHAGAA
jgi:NitT/TauT family transport system ATP-binding protein